MLEGKLDPRPKGFEYPSHDEKQGAHTAQNETGHENWTERIDKWRNCSAHGDEGDKPYAYAVW